MAIKHGDAFFNRLPLSRSIRKKHMTRKSELCVIYSFIFELQLISLPILLFVSHCSAFTNILTIHRTDIAVVINSMEIALMLACGNLFNIIALMLFLLGITTVFPLCSAKSYFSVFRIDCLSWVFWLSNITRFIFLVYDFCCPCENVLNCVMCFAFREFLA